MSDQQRGVTISRKELYRRVWSTPVSILAAEFGLSDRGLARLCERYEIPVPPRGYWAKLAAGKKVVLFKLPDLGKKNTQIYIAPTQPADPPEQLPLSIQEVMERAAQAEPIAVAETLRSPHPIIEAWLTDNKADIERGRKWNSYVPDALTESAIGRRRLRLLNALFKSAPDYGLKVEPHAQGRYEATFAALDQKLTYSLYEKIQRNRRKAPRDLSERDSRGDLSRDHTAPRTGPRTAKGRTEAVGGTEEAFGERKDRKNRPESLAARLGYGRQQPTCKNCP